MKYNLTPDTLAFSSFRHSQGGDTAQMTLLAFVEAETGVKANFQPTGDALLRYKRFLQSDILGRHQSIPDGMISEALWSANEGFVDNWANKEYGTRRELLDAFTGSVLSQESNLFNRAMGTLEGPQPQGYYLSRVQERNRRGQLSMYLTHAIGGVATEHPVFDKLYDASYHESYLSPTDPELENNIAEHDSAHLLVVEMLDEQTTNQ